MLQGDSSGYYRAFLTRENLWNVDDFSREQLSFVAHFDVFNHPGGRNGLAYFVAEIINSNFSETEFLKAKSIYGRKTNLEKL